MKRSLGVCYYPEHWPEEAWAGDAALMAETGLTWVRIGEFAWSRLEPAEGRYCFDWLDRAIETLGRAGLQVVLGTPTATPPRWVAGKHPDMLAIDAEGRPRKFGSRRHYCFSHEGYIGECGKIVTQLAKRYGRNPHVHAWQIDNEYGCHATTLSYSDSARAAFRNWLSRRYRSMEELNSAWGNVFWSMDYAGFDEVDLPNMTVTEPNPSHAMAFRRFSSEQVARFNQAQARILRRHTDAPLMHNYMGREIDFDHFEVGRDLDIASWDSYPLGFLSDRLDAPKERIRKYLRQGDPDCQAFHHDLYRAVGAANGNGAPHEGRWWVMEQQPGPVNWAPWNPAPLPGMARLWAWEAFAHGAEAVCYFRWRQAPFAQEQQHAGLLRPDGAPAPALAEAAQVAREIAGMPETSPCQAEVALIFDYAAAWAWDIQPQGADFTYFHLMLDTYRGLRKLGLSVDILPVNTASFAGYRLALAPGLTTIPEHLMSALAKMDGIAVLGPRANAKTNEMSTPVPLPPNIPGLDLIVACAESLPPGEAMPLSMGGACIRWFEHLEGKFETFAALADGRAAVARHGNIAYTAGWLNPEGMRGILADLCSECGIEHRLLPDGIRIRDTAMHRFTFNYSAQESSFDGITLPPAGVHWQLR